MHTIAVIVGSLMFYAVGLAGFQGLSHITRWKALASTGRGAGMLRSVATALFPVEERSALSAEVELPWHVAVAAPVLDVVLMSEENLEKHRKTPRAWLALALWLTLAERLLMPLVASSYGLPLIPIQAGMLAAYSVSVFLFAREYLRRLVMLRAAVIGAGSGRGTLVELAAVAGLALRRVGAIYAKSILFFVILDAYVGTVSVEQTAGREVYAICTAASVALSFVAAVDVALAVAIWRGGPKGAAE